MRIEVGRGLEGRLTDLMAGRITDLVVKPKFKRGDFDGGFFAGVTTLIDATRGEFKADQNHRPRKHEKASRLMTFLICAGIAMLVLGSISRILGGVAGAAGLPAVVAMTVSSVGLVPMIILAVLGFAAGLLLPALFSTAGRHGRGGFWPGGGYYGGGFGGGGV